MPATKIVDGIERFVLCDPSAPSQWVPAKPTNGTPPIEAFVEETIKKRMEAMTERMEAMTERMDARMEEMNLRTDARWYAIARKIENACAQIARLQRQLLKEDAAAGANRGEVRHATRVQGPSGAARMPSRPGKAKEGGLKPSKETLIKLYNMPDAAFEKQRMCPKGVTGFWGVSPKPNGRYQTNPYVGSYDSKEVAARAHDHHLLSSPYLGDKPKVPNNTAIHGRIPKPHDRVGKVAHLNFHPRNYLTPDGELLPLSEVVGGTEGMPEKRGRGRPSKKRKAADSGSIGRRVSVWWEAEREFYDGTVTKKRAAEEGEDVLIEYDDGDRQWHNTVETRIVEVTEANAVSPSRPFQTRYTAEPLTPPARSHLSSRRLQVRGRERPRMPPGLAARPAQGVVLMWISRRRGA